MSAPAKTNTATARNRFSNLEFMSFSPLLKSFYHLRAQSSYFATAAQLRVASARIRFVLRSVNAKAMKDRRHVKPVHEKDLPVKVTPAHYGGVTRVGIYSATMVDLRGDQCS
jgi:hypothetical protein